MFFFFFRDFQRDFIPGSIFPIYFFGLIFNLFIMVSVVSVPVRNVVKKYQDILYAKGVLFTVSSNMPIFEKDEKATRHFCAELFRDKEMFLEFLREVGLIKPRVVCPECKGFMNI